LSEGDLSSTTPWEELLLWSSSIGLSPSYLFIYYESTSWILISSDAWGLKCSYWRSIVIPSSLCSWSETPAIDRYRKSNLFAWNKTSKS